MRVLAAMSGGVDSAVAAARAVDAGHDVTGVHLALSSNPQSFRSGAREKNSVVSGTICDALMAQTPGELTFAINRELVGEGTAVSDAEVTTAVAFAFRELKLVVEPGGAAALAALLSGKVDVSGKTAVIVLSGGNVDPDLFARLVA